MTDQMREMVNLESAWADKWRARAEAAEKWWAEAAPLMASIGRKVALPGAEMTQLRRLMEWEPEKRV